MFRLRMPVQARRCAPIAAIAVTILLAPACATAEGDKETMRAAMRDVYAALHVLLPLALDAEEFGSEARAPSIRDALARLSERAVAVRRHAESTEAGAIYVANVLARDAEAAARAFEQGRLAAAGYAVQQTLESCVTCHSRQSNHDARISEQFLEDPIYLTLEPDQRATLLFAVRRFDDAAREYERALRSDTLEPAKLLGSLVDYVTLCVRSLDQVARPAPVLRRIALRADLWLQFRDDLLYWAEVLEAEEREPQVVSLAAARKAIERARALGIYPSDRRAFVHYILASRILHQRLAEPENPVSAEHYYLLGIAEARIGRNHWIEQSRFYLELAIRLDPSTEVAYRALALLEEELLFEYGETDPANLPASLRDRVEELRRLVVRSRVGT